MKIIKRPYSLKTQQLLISAGILALGIVGLWQLLILKVGAKQQSPNRQATIVEALSITKLARTNTEISAYGTVIPAHKLDLRAEVSGQIVAVLPRLRPGMTIEANTTLAHIDPTTYEQALVQAQSRVLSAEAALELEQGQQVIAKEEFDLLNPKVDVASKVRALRKPQLKQKQADLQTALSQLTLAQRDLEKTKLTTSFPALVLGETLEIGQFVSNQAIVATLVDIREFYIEVELPVELLGQIRPEGKASINVRGAVLSGKVIGPIGDIDPQNRLARLLVQVPDPLTGPTRLLIGDYVQVNLEGMEFRDVFEIPRSSLRSYNNIWKIVEDKLRVLPVEVLFSKDQTVLVQGSLQDGDQLIVSSIPVVEDGMLVAVNTADSR